MSLQLNKLCSMDPKPFRKANNASFCKEIPLGLLNPKVHYHFQKARLNSIF
jgi:hypothetical protein